jgi:hypothetical protein
MTKNQLNLVRVLIEHASIVEVDNVKDGAYDYDDINYNKVFSDKEFEEVRDYLDNLVSTMPTDLDI